MISTKGRYAVRILLDLAEHRDAGYIPMKEVVKRQGMSLKYVERILPALRDAGLISGLHGKGGGYRLTREPEQYTLFEILRCAEVERQSAERCRYGKHMTRRQKSTFPVFGFPIC